MTKKTREVAETQIWQTRVKSGAKRFIYVHLYLHLVGTAYARCVTVIKAGPGTWRRKRGARTTMIRVKEFARFRYVATGAYID